jgi:hypothetical protein
MTDLASSPPPSPQPSPQIATTLAPKHIRKSSLQLSPSWSKGKLKDVERYPEMPLLPGDEVPTVQIPVAVEDYDADMMQVAFFPLLKETLAAEITTKEERTNVPDAVATDGNENTASGIWEDVP